MALKLILEINEHRQVFPLDELAKSFFAAIQSAIRQEVERAVSSGPPPILQQAKNTQVIPPAALSKTKAAQALGVSVRTLDYCIAQRKIRVMRIGRRVVVPMNSIEAVLKRSVLETHRGKRQPDP